MYREHGEFEAGLEYEQTREFAETVSYTERLNRLVEITKDSDVRNGLAALLRTGANTGLAVADLPVFPLVGDAASWTADACKLVARRFNVPMLDTSPDVSVGTVFGAELVEICTGSLVPSKAVEAALQLRADWPRIKSGFEQVKKIWTGRRQELAAPEVQEAIGKFEK